MADEFKVTFWGVRGSHPVPGKETLLFGGNTTCLEISIGNATLVIDSGTGAIELGKKIAGDYFKNGASGPLEITQLFTHLHHDHTQGLPFFSPLYLGQSVIHFFGPRNFGKELEAVMECCMKPPNFPINFFQSNSIKYLHTVMDNNLILLDVNSKTPKLLNKFHEKPEVKDTSILIRILNDYSHPANGVYVYRIEHGGKSVVFSTDVEGYMYGDARLAQFAKGADLLIHDAQYSREQYTALPVPKQGFGHSIPEMAIEVARVAGAKQLALTHHDPTSTDQQLKKNETRYRRQFQNLVYTREGLTITVG